MYNYQDKAGLTYVIATIKSYLTTYLAAKVDTENGKGLSTNDFTTALKTKLEGLVQVVVDSAITAASTNPVESQAIYSALQLKANLASPALTGTPTAPTATAGDNTTQIATTAFVTSAIATAIAGITGVSFQVVQTLPQTGESNVIYLVPKTTALTQNVYDEYIWISSSSSYELIGSTAIDLSNYVQNSDMVAITTAEIDAMFATW